MNLQLKSFASQKQTGATMIEILIAILVFSIGLLGIASTQTLGITNTQSALNKSYAVQYVYELIDIMRANKTIVNSSDNNIFAKYATVKGDGSGNRTEPYNYEENSNCLDATTSCKAIDLAKHELAVWEKRIESLPDGQASIKLNGRIYTVLITWADVKGANEQTGKLNEFNLATNEEQKEDQNIAEESMATALLNNRGFYRFQLDFQL